MVIKIGCNVIICAGTDYRRDRVPHNCGFLFLKILNGCGYFWVRVLEFTFRATVQWRIYGRPERFPPERKTN